MQNPLLVSASAEATDLGLLKLPSSTIRQAAIDIAIKGIESEFVISGLLRDFNNFTTSNDCEQKADLASWIAFALLNHFSDAPSIETKKAINELLHRAPNLAILFGKLYGLPKEKWNAKFQFIDFGTTSLVMKLDLDDKVTAVKFVKPRYWEQDTVKQQTSSYLEKYGHTTRWTPRVLATSDLWIEMDFINGVTYERWIAEAKSAESKVFWSSIEFILSEILEGLEELSSRYCVSHLDLNPKNVLLQITNGIPTRVWLIDFGTNFAMTERVGRPGQYGAIFASVEIFVPPETFTRALTLSPISDLYSIGMLMLSAFSAGPLARSTLGTDLQRMWQRCPELASLIENLIEPEPSKRLIGWELERDLFATVQKKIENGIILLQEADQHILANEPRIENVWHILLGTWTSSIADVKIFPKREILESRKAFLPDPAYFRFWGALSILSHYFIFSSFILLTLIDIAAYADSSITRLAKDIVAWPFFSWFDEWYRDQAYLPVEVGAVYQNLPGRLICVSFSVVATKFYLRIYSMIYPNTRNDTLSRISETVMRVNAISYLLPISVALFVNPKWWPYCVFAGIVPVAANNWLTLQVIRRANEEAGNSFYTNEIQSTDSFIKEFAQWWSQMTIYSVAIVSLGPLLYYDVLEDEMAYALIVIAINYLQIIRIIIGQAGFEVRGGLKRLIELDRRVYISQSQRLDGSRLNDPFVRGSPS